LGKRKLIPQKKLGREKKKNDKKYVGTASRTSNGAGQRQARTKQVESPSERGKNRKTILTTRRRLRNADGAQKAYGESNPQHPGATPNGNSRVNPGRKLGAPPKIIYYKSRAGKKKRC